VRRSLAALILANATSLTGNVVAIVAIPWFVLETSGSSGRTGIAAFCTALPLGIGALVGGAVVDRVGARGTSIVSDLAAGALFASIPILHAAGALPYWATLVLVVAGGLFDGPGQAARAVLLPELRDRAQVSPERANALWTTTEHAGYVLGAPLAGIAIAVLGAPTAVLLDAASFGGSALLIALSAPRGATMQSADAHVLDGLRLVLREPTLRIFLWVWTLGNFLIAPLAPVWLPLYAHDRLGGSAALGALVTAYGVGGILGAAAYGVLARVLPARRIFGSIRIAYPIVCAALIALPPLAGAIAVLFLIGLVPGIGVPLYQLVLQAETPAPVRGRVFSVFAASLSLTAPFAMVIGGALAGAIGLRATFAVYAATSLVLSAWSWRSVAQLLDVTREREPAASP
jgi:MFS family permease